MGKKANELLFEAAKNNDLNGIKEALKLGAKINKSSQWDGTALHIAASKGNLEIIDFLLEQGADSTQLEMADFTPLHLAARDGQIDAVKLLLEKGGPYNDRLLSDISSIVNMSGRYPAIADLIRKKRIALIKPETDELSEEDAKLFTAVYDGNLEKIKEIISAGANINCVDDRGISVLRWAVRRNYLAIVKFLLEAGAEINAVSNFGWTALMEACMNGHLDIVKYLLMKGAEVNLKTKVNATAIYFAAYDGYLEIVKLLLKNNADPTIEAETYDIHGDYTISPIQAASENGHFEIVKILKNFYPKQED